MASMENTIYWLKDYTVCDYLMSAVDLTLDLSQKPVQAHATLTLRRNPKAKTYNPLILDGEHLIITALSVNQIPLNIEQYEVHNSSLTLAKAFDDAVFTVEMTCLLSESTDLFGLYETEGTVLVKAETQGLRRVFYCIDRPDNLAIYKTTLIAEQQKYPTLLANGVLINHEQRGNGCHAATWLDNLPKPSYLFAAVAGNFDHTSALFKTRSGRELPIIFYVSSQNINKCHFAQEVLKLAMAWDERVYKLDCDLARHMVAGVDKYASGASEPTGLNLFNTENLFATAASKTDEGILRVLEVVAHEFFHYWSGNRVTIRDWFNLPFKEGLTTFRADMFREQLFGAEIIRLLDNKTIDPRAPRQESYSAVRSLYTAAAYEKSADIFRMIMNVLGEQLFHQYMGQFLRVHDGDAVTLEEVLNFLSNASSVDVTPFLSWFTQAGIPEVNITERYEPARNRYSLSIQVNGAANRPIPLSLTLLSDSGEELMSNQLLMLLKPQTQFYFNDITSKPTPSFLRGFSAPITLNYTFSDEQLMRLMQHDRCIYSRSQAAAHLIKNKLRIYCTNGEMPLNDAFFNAYLSILTTNITSPWLLAELLSLPSIDEVFASLIFYDYNTLSTGLNLIQKALAAQINQTMYTVLKTHQETITPTALVGDFDIHQAGIRRLRATYYSYLQHIDVQSTEEQLVTLFNTALGTNMTETINALTLLAEMNYTGLDTLLNNYYNYWRDDAHAINYWFSVQAGIHNDGVILRVERLLQHQAFDMLNPNKVYALLGAFIRNPYGFHNKSGHGYQLIAQVIITLDKINPPIAANFTQKFIEWPMFDAQRQYLMINAIQTIAAQTNSIDVKNNLSKIYEQNPEHFTQESQHPMQLEELKPK